MRDVEELFLNELIYGLSFKYCDYGGTCPTRTIWILDLSQFFFEVGREQLLQSGEYRGSFWRTVYDASRESPPSLTIPNVYSAFFEAWYFSQSTRRISNNAIKMMDARKVFCLP